MDEKPESTRKPSLEQYLALGGALHALVEGISTTAYPIRSWSDLLEAARSMDDVTLIGPSGKMSLHERLEPTMSHISPILGDQYFPIENQEDFARKAGLAIVTLATRYISRSHRHEPPNK